MEHRLAAIGYSHYPQATGVDRGAARICTGTLIDPSRVLTAVHCVYNHTPSTTFCQRQLAGRCIDRRVHVVRGRIHSAAAVELQRDLNRCLTRAGCDHHMKTGATVAAFA